MPAMITAETILDINRIVKEHLLLSKVTSKDVGPLAEYLIALFSTMQQGNAAKYKPSQANHPAHSAFEKLVSGIDASINAYCEDQAIRRSIYPGSHQDVKDTIKSIKPEQLLEWVISCIEQYTRKIAADTIKKDIDKSLIHLNIWLADQFLVVIDRRLARWKKIILQL